MSPAIIPPAVADRHYAIGLPLVVFTFRITVSHSGA